MCDTLQLCLVAYPVWTSVLTCLPQMVVAASAPVSTCFSRAKCVGRQCTVGLLKDQLAVKAFVNAVMSWHNAAADAQDRRRPARSVGM